MSQNFICIKLKFKYIQAIRVIIDRLDNKQMSFQDWKIFDFKVISLEDYLNSNAVVARNF